MNLIRSLNLVILLFWFCWNTTANAQSFDKIAITDLTKIVSISNHQISPDGTTVFYVKNHIEVMGEDSYQYKSQVWKTALTPPFSSSPVTSSDYNVSSFQLSPDGKNLAFARMKDGKSQIYSLPTAGGESQQVTREKNGASNPVWSPNSTHILFSITLPIWAIEGIPDWEQPRPGRSYGDEPNYKAIQAGLAKEHITPNPDGTIEELRAFLAKNNAKNDPKVIDRLNFLGELDLSPDLNFSHLGIVDLRTGISEIITSGFQSYFGATWSPDMKSIFASSLFNSIHPDETSTTEVWKIDISTKQASKFFGMENFRIGNPTFSPDGRWIAVGGQNINEPSYNQSMIGVMKADGSGFKWLTETLDRSVSAPSWTGDSQSLYFTGASNGGFHLWRASIHSGKIDPIISGQVGVNSFDIVGQKLVYSLTTVDQIAETYLAELTNRNAQQISNWNSKWLAGKQLSLPTFHTLQTADGFEIEYWVMPPVNIQEGVKYPTILNMHGGPSAMWGPGEFSMWHEFQVMAAKGYGVVYANPRGSGGYGKAFQKGNFQDWGDGPASDVLAALDQASEKYSWIDKDQYFLTGGSYAGYLTAWIVGHDHRFKAAFAQRGVYELTFFLGEGNAWRLVPNHFGYPWEEGVKEIMDYNSPQTYVQNIQTPLLIKHGDQDLRTGVRQSELLYKSLKILGKPVEYVRYPGEGHELSRSGAIHRRIDRMARIIEFFERYVQHP